MPLHRPTKATREQVRTLAGLNAPRHLIAAAVKIRKVETLERFYAKELEDGPAAVQLELREQLLNAARSDNGAGRVTATTKLAELLVGDGNGGDDNTPLVVWMQPGDEKL